MLWEYHVAAAAYDGGYDMLIDASGTDLFFLAAKGVRLLDRACHETRWPTAVVEDPAVTAMAIDATSFYWTDGPLLQVIGRP